MATTPTTYRVSPEVDAELRRLAEIHGGVDKALRVQFGWLSPVANQKDAVSVSIERVVREPRNKKREVKPEPVRPHTMHSASHPIAGCTICAEMK